VGLNDGEGGSGKADGYIGTCSGIAIAGDVGNGAGTATERARSALPVIWPQKHGPSFGAPVWPGCGSCKAWWRHANTACSVAPPGPAASQQAAASVNRISRGVRRIASSVRPTFRLAQPRPGRV